MAVVITPGPTVKAADIGSVLMQSWSIAFGAANDTYVLDLAQFTGGYALFFLTAVAAGGTINIRQVDALTPTTNSGAFPGAAGSNNGQYYIGSKTAANNDPWQISNLPRFLQFVCTVGTATIYFEAHAPVGMNRNR